MKHLAVFLLGLLFAFPEVDENLQQKYIDTYAQVAISEMERTGVPASITLAQGMLESDYGCSELAAQYNNHFGIKCHSDWKGAKTYYDDDRKKECFRVYSSAIDSFKDHSDFLRYQSRYAFLFDLKPTDYKGWARGLKSAGYATDPSYAVKLIQLIEELGLDEYDYGMPEGRTRRTKGSSKTDRPSSAKPVSVPRSPRDMEQPHLVDTNYKEQFKFTVSRPIYELNGVPCVYAMDGETYESIALSHNLFRKELLRFNDLQQDSRLDPGTIVFLQPKKNQAEKGLDKYIVGPDEHVTLREISQKFGVKESALRKMNKFSKTYVPLEGDTILLRK